MKNDKFLIAPENYWKASLNKMHKNTNGCGSSGLIVSIVPDSLLGLNISDACDIHDYMYEQGGNKKQADDVFLENMKFIINQETDSMILNSLRKAKAYIYYFAVKIFGSSFFGAAANN